MYMYVCIPCNAPPRHSATTLLRRAAPRRAAPPTCGAHLQNLSRHRVASKAEALRLLSHGHARRSQLVTAIGSSSSRVRAPAADGALRWGVVGLVLCAFGGLRLQS
jgi:hypothetical protein